MKCAVQFDILIPKNAVGAFFSSNKKKVAVFLQGEVSDSGKGVLGCFWL